MIDKTIILGHLHHILKNPEEIFKIASPTNDELELAFFLKPEMARKFENIPEEVQLAMIKESVYNVQYIIHPTELVQVHCIEQDPETYKLINSPTKYSFYIAHPFMLLP